MFEVRVVFFTSQWNRQGTCMCTKKDDVFIKIQFIRGFMCVVSSCVKNDDDSNVFFFSWIS